MPSVGLTNLLIAPSGKTKGMGRKELFYALGQGLYIKDAMGVHMANPVSGDFSLGVTGLWIERGEISHPVKEAVLSGNILDLFGKISAIGDDLTFYGNMGSPALMVTDMDVSA